MVLRQQCNLLTLIPHLNFEGRDIDYSFEVFHIPPSCMMPQMHYESHSVLTTTLATPTMKHVFLLILLRDATLCITRANYTPP